MKIYVVQHCQSEHHVNGLTGGWTDTPLTDLGIKQAREVAKKLKELIDGEVVIYSSDLLRAHGTANEISKELKSDVILESGLRERNYGIATGQTRKWLNERIIPQPKGNIIDHLPIEGAETWRVFYNRLAEAMEKIVDPAIENLIVVTHGGAKNNVIAWWLDMPVESMNRASFYGKPGGITTLSSWDGRRQLDKLSE